MTKKEVMELATELSRRKNAMRSIGMMNTPTDTEEMVKSQVAYRIAHDQYVVANRNYEAAFEKWAAAGFPEDDGEKPVQS